MIDGLFRAHWTAARTLRKYRLVLPGWLRMATGDEERVGASSASEPSLQAGADGLDWHAVAEQRLVRMLGSEDRAALACERLERLQNEHHQAQRVHVAVEIQLTETRLRLVEREHDLSLLHDRHADLLAEQRQLLDDRERRLLHLDRLSRQLEKQVRRCDELTGQFSVMHASFVHSLSWRLTRPLRGLAAAIRSVRRRFGRWVRACLQVRSVRRMARMAARCAPGLGARIRSRLYPP